MTPDDNEATAERDVANHSRKEVVANDVQKSVINLQERAIKAEGERDAAMAALRVVALIIGLGVLIAFLIRITH